MIDPNCNYDYYNTKGTDSNYHRLPLYTPDLQLCQKYFDDTITDQDYSKLKDANGYLCNPWCNIDNNKCSSNKISLDNNFWVINGKKTNYANHIVRTMLKGDYNDPKNECALLNDEEKNCSTIDSVCCGKGFAKTEGEYCDRLDKNRLYVSACYDGQPNQCCGHGTCQDGICKCDTGYAGNCCDCADGYSKNPQGQCVEDTVNCCNFKTGEITQVPKEQCTGDLKIVDDPQKCFPPGVWCDSINNFDCNTLTNRDEYLAHKNDYLNDCNYCFPPNKFVCSNKTCSTENFTEFYKKDDKSSNTLYMLYIGIIVSILLYFSLIFLLKKRK